MSPTAACAACVVVVLTLGSASTSAVGSSDADAAAAAAEATGPPVAGGLTIVQRIRADPALSTCDVYPLRSLIASKSLNEEFLQCTDIAVPDGDSVVFSDGEKDAVVPFCLANFFSLEVLCKAPSGAAKSKKPLIKDVNDFVPTVEFCSKLESTLVLFDCEAVKANVPEASVARCDAFNRARETLIENCPKVCAIGGIGFEAQCKHLFLTSVLVKNTMANVEATAGGHVKKSSANEAAKDRVIAAPPLSSSSSTKKSAVLQKPDADGEEELLHGNRISRAVNESVSADEGKENDKGVDEQWGSPAIGSEGGTGNATTVEKRKVSDVVSGSNNAAENKNNNGTSEEKKPAQQSAEQDAEGDSKNTTAVAVDEGKENDKGVSELSAVGSKGGNATVETEPGDVAENAAEKTQNNATSAENKAEQSMGQAPEGDAGKPTTMSPTTEKTADKNVPDNLPSNAATADGKNATADNSTDVNQADKYPPKPKEPSEANNGVEENAAEQPGAAVGRGDAAKEKEEVGNVQEAEKPNAPEAPKRKEDEITNEGGEQQEGLHPRWKPRPQAPQQQPPPAFIDKMGAGLEAQANYFSYFVVIAILCIVFYLVFHNKQKILALILEGRRQKGSGRRRSSGAQYRKLDNHLEEAGGIDGNGADNAASVRNIIY